MIRVAQPADPLEAQHLLGVLQEHGIRAVVQGEALWAARGELPFTPESAPSIWVADEADAQQARQILAEHRTPQNPPRCPRCGFDLAGVREPRCPNCYATLRIEQTWTCPHCREIIGVQFTHCWNCGAENSDRSGSRPATSDTPSDPEAASPPCTRCGGTGQIERRFMPVVLIACGAFLGFAAIYRLAEYSSVGAWPADFLVRRLLFAVAAVLCTYIALRSRRTSCPCREGPEEP